MPGASEALVRSWVGGGSLWWVGLSLDAVATLAGTVGKQLLRYAAVSKRPCFYLLGLFLTAVVDPVFDIAAYSFAAQSIIAAAAGLVVVWNVLLAPCTLGEELTPSRAVGATLICAGTVFVGAFGSHEETVRTPDEYCELFARPEALAYYAAFAAWTCLCCAQTGVPGLVAGRGSPLVRGFFLAALGGSIAGNSFTTKAAVELGTCGPADAGCPPTLLASPAFLLLAAGSLCTATLSLFMLAVGLRSFEALYMITVYEGFMIISGAVRRGARRAARGPRAHAARAPRAPPTRPPHLANRPQVSGNFVMNEKLEQAWLRLALYWASIGVVIYGLYVLCVGEVHAIGARQAGAQRGMV